MADTGVFQGDIEIAVKVQFRHRRTRDDLGAHSPKIGEAALRHHRKRLDPLGILGATRQMHLARRYEAGHAAIDVHLDPAGLVLAGGPVAEDRVAMAVDQPRRHGATGGVNLVVGGFGGEARDHAILDQKAVAVGQGGVQIAGEQQADIADQAATGGRCILEFNSHSKSPILFV